MQPSTDYSDWNKKQANKILSEIHEIGRKVLGTILDREYGDNWAYHCNTDRGISMTIAVPFMFLEN